MLDTVRFLGYRRVNSTKYPASEAGKLSEPRLMSNNRESAPSLVCVDQRVFALRAVEVPVFVCLRGSCSHVGTLVGPKG